MNEVELLKLQVEALEKLIRVKQETIAELEKQLNLARTNPVTIQYLPNPNTILIPSVWTTPVVDICQHEYPFPWHSISPPPCKKCGKTASQWTVTCDSAVSGILSIDNSGSIPGTATFLGGTQHE